MKLYTIIIIIIIIIIIMGKKADCRQLMSSK